MNDMRIYCVLLSDSLIKKITIWISDVYSVLLMRPLFSQVLTDVLIPATMQEMPERFVTSQLI